MVVVGFAAFVESDDPEVVPLEFFEGADEIDDAGDAQVLGRAGAGFDGNGTEGRGTALGEHDAVNAGTVGDADRAPRFWGSSTPSSARTSRAAPPAGRELEIFDELAIPAGGQWRRHPGGREFLRADGELLARLLKDADAGLAAFRDEALKTVSCAHGPRGRGQSAAFRR